MKVRFPTRLETLAFVCGFTLMTFELVAARVLAPTIGSSTYVWTSVIGVIIAALSLGFYLGGRLADARNRRRDVMWLLLATASLIAITTLLYPYVLPWLASSGVDVRLQAVAAAMMLFAPTSLVLGMVSPYLAKLNVTSLKTAGAAVANLSMWDAIGGITGTFLTGFLLFGYMGSRAIFILLTLIVVLSISLLGERFSARHWWIVGVSLYVVALAPTYSRVTNIDTPTAHYTVFEWRDQAKQFRGLAMGPGGVQSGVDIHAPNEPVFWYTRQIANLIDHTPQRHKILMLGGGTFTLPQQIALKYPQSSIDVVEIDPELVDVARKHFFYRDPANVNLLFEDARTYSNQTQNRYDMIVVDTYGNTDIPFTFMTAEYGHAIAKILKPGGTVIVNMLAGQQGGCGQLFSALEAPYRQNFRYRAIRSSADNGSEKFSHNIVGVYSNSLLDYEGFSDTLTPAVRPYSDDFTPAERLRQKCLA